MQPALQAINEFVNSGKSIPVMEQAGLLQARFLSDPSFVNFQQLLLQIDMGREPEFMKAGLNHWSRRWEYPYTIHGVLRYLKSRGIGRGKLLDAACGFSPVPFALAALGHDVLGIDLDEECPKQWEGYTLPHAHSDGSTKFQFANMEETKIPSDHFDAVYCVSSLEHTAAPEKGLREFLRVTKPGGMILLTCDCEPAGSTGMESAKVDRMLAEMDGQGQLYYPPRWCHPFEALTFLTRAAVRNESAIMRFARNTKEAMRINKSSNMSVLGIAWIKNK